ncbi:MAG: hypothetical protein K0B16_01285 [Burkholderiaceae bacterium]|nr:hypothetical protein [Burkholderiaceae bacterium]
MLELFVNDRPIRFAAEIKAVDRFQTLGAIKAMDARGTPPTLLVAPYITAATAQRCREIGLPFIDEAGNAYLEAPGLFVYVTGKRRAEPTRMASAARALAPAGLRIVFALLHNPELAGASYREIARTTGVALGTVGNAMADLEARGHLAPEQPGPRRLLAPERLQQEWVTHYPIRLRPKLQARRFTAPRPDWWRDLDIGLHQAYWGGEVAAEKLTGYLKAEKLTLYVKDRPDPLILANRLRPERDGEIEILEAFWIPDEANGDIAPPLVVYADLMASTDPRNIEAAELIRDRYLAKAPRAA